MAIKTSGCSEHKYQNEMRTDLNFSELINQITPRRLINAAVILGSGYAASTVGAILGTGVGFTCLGPGGAVAGFQSGNYAGWVAGIIAGTKIASFITGEIGEWADVGVLAESRTIFSSEHNNNLKVSAA